MNFAFLDQIYELKPGIQTLGSKRVTSQQQFLMPDINGDLRLIPCLVGEAIGQLCSWNVIKSSNFQFRPVGGIIGQLRLIEDVHVGETIELENTINELNLDNQVVVFHGVAKVGGRKIFEAHECIAPLLPLELLNDPEQVKLDFEHLYQPGARPSTTQNKVNVEPFSSQAEGIYSDLFFDEILTWELGKEVLAKKNISASAVYFLTHFPRKPVLPMCLLLQCKLHLAYQFIDQCTPEAKIRSWAIQARRIKMGHFIHPGDCLITQMRVVHQQSESICVHFRSEVGVRKVCLAEVVFQKGS